MSKYTQERRNTMIAEYCLQHHEEVARPVQISQESVGLFALHACQFACILRAHTLKFQLV